MGRARTLSNGGLNANKSGQAYERLIETLIRTHAKLACCEYARTLEGLTTNRGALFDADELTGQYGRQITVALRGDVFEANNRITKADFAMCSFDRRIALVSVKSQESDGSADSKLWWEIEQLIATQKPAAVVVLGPNRKPGQTGWSGKTLASMWDALKQRRNNSILMFRETDTFTRWLMDGFPITGKGATGTFEDVWQKYASNHPWLPGDDRLQEED